MQNSLINSNFRKKINSEITEILMIIMQNILFFFVIQIYRNKNIAMSFENKGIREVFL